MNNLQEKEDKVKLTWPQLIMIVSFIFFTACGSIKGCSKNNAIDSIINTINSSYEPDNVFEEATEDFVEGITGLEVDFSPSSEEIE